MKLSKLEIKKIVLCGLISIGGVFFVFNETQARIVTYSGFCNFSDETITYCYPPPTGPLQINAESNERVWASVLDFSISGGLNGSGDVVLRGGTSGGMNDYQVLSWTEGQCGYCGGLNLAIGPLGSVGDSWTDFFIQGRNTSAVSWTWTVSFDVYGCTDPAATNYDSSAGINDGSCIYPPTAYIHCNGSDGSCGSIPYANAAAVDWGSQNADSCNVPGIGSSGPIGSGSTGYLTSNQSYTVTCTGPGGSANDSVTVYVGPSATIGCNGPGNCSIPYNSNAILSWSSNNANRCELYQDWNVIGTNFPYNGTLSIGPLTSNHEYEAVCKNSNPDNPFYIATTYVTVGPPVYGCMDNTAANFNPSANVDDGSCKYWVTLNFYVNGTCGAVAGATVTINQDFGNGTTRTTDGAGFANFGVYSNTTIGWTVSASGYTTRSGSITTGSIAGSTTAVSVNMGNPAGYGNACTVTNACGQSNTGTIQCGGSCSVSAPPNPPGYGNVCTSAPNACGMTNTGTIQCDGSCSATTPPNSSCPVPTASLTASPNPVNYNTASTLTWSSTHTHPSSCSIPGLVTNGPTSGSVSTGLLTSNQTYTVTCQGLNGSPVSESVTVTVPAPTADIRCDNINGPCNLSWNGSSLIEWCGSNAQACANAASCSVTRNGSPWASGTSGAQSTGAQIVPGTFTYALTCSGNGSASDNAQVVVANPIPATSNVTVIQPDYCVSGPAATVGWDYSDPAGSPQSSYQVQITNIGNFNNPLYDSCIPAPGSCASGYSSNLNFTGQGVLQFNTTYKARVRTWNGYNQPSAWVESNSFLTPNHAYPNVNPQYQFTWSPLNPAINKPVQFTDRTLFDPTSNNKQWSWTFVPAGGGSGSSTAQSPAYSFNTEGVYQVTESVRDNAVPPGQYCSYTQAINIQKPIPVWKEIAPR